MPVEPPSPVAASAVWDPMFPAPGAHHLLPPARGSEWRLCHGGFPFPAPDRRSSCGCFIENQAEVVVGVGHNFYTPYDPSGPVPWVRWAKRIDAAWFTHTDWVTLFLESGLHSVVFEIREAALGDPYEVLTCHFDCAGCHKLGRWLRERELTRIGVYRDGGPKLFPVDDDIDAPRSIEFVEA